MYRLRRIKRTIRTFQLAFEGNINNTLNEYTPKAWMRGESIQVAYSFGGIGLKYAQTNYDNTAYGFDAKTPKDAKIFALSLAF